MNTDTSAAIAAGMYVIDPSRSHITFTATHAFGLGPVNGTLTVRDGTIAVTIDPAKSKATARVDAASFTTDGPRRDKDIRSKRFLHVDQYADLLFASDRLARDGDRWLLHGTLTVRGTTAPAILELTSAGTIRAGDCRFHARTRIDRYAYRVGPRGIIGRYVDVELDIVGSAQAQP